jgi:hypothetical protein
MLASGMKESNTYEVSFPDIAPATWESMMKFLDTHLAVRYMTVKDVMEVAPWYDKYDFPGGREFSGHIITEYIKGMDMAPIPDDLDFFIDAILLADALHLDEAKNTGVLWINMTMYHHTRNILSRDHIAKLAPLIAKEDSLIATVKLFVKSDVTKDDILHGLFPELLVEKLASYRNKKTIQEWAPIVKLSGSGSNADGDYIPLLSSSHTPNELCFLSRGIWGRQEVYFKIIVKDEIWVIVGEAGDNENILWKCPHSRSLMLPPRDGWVPVDELAIGTNPTLNFIMRTEE